MIEKKEAFTLMELMIVIILIGIVVGLGLPNYMKSLKKAYERDIIMQFTYLHGALEIYHTKKGRYPITSVGDLAEINQALGTNIVPSGGIVYAYVANCATGGVFLGGCYTVRATWADALGRAFIIFMQDSPFDIMNNPLNPCCETNNCPSLARCTIVH